MSEILEKESVWLGRYRGPVRTAAITFTAIAGLIWLWLIVNNILFDDAYGMHEMIRPQGKPIVWAMLASLLLSIVTVAIYLSDFIGAIEDKPGGFFDVLSLVTSRMAMIMIALIVLVMFYEVVARYVFLSPTLWANELSLWIAGVVFLFAGQYAMQQRSHIRIYVIYDIMPRWARKTADCVSVLLIVGFTFALVWGGYNDAETRLLRMETFGTAWDPPIPGTMKAVILFIICLVAVQAVSNLIADWNKAPEHHTDELDEQEIENIRKTLED